MKSNLIIFVFLIFTNRMYAQLVAGPIIGHTTPHSTVIWYEQNIQNFDTAYLWIRSGNQKISIDSIQQIVFGNKRICRAYFNRLNPSTNYEIKFGFKTKKIYKIRTPSNHLNSDFSFFVGSCILTLPKPFQFIYPNNKVKIFDQMGRDTSPEFMLWIGDYVYYTPQNLTSRMSMFNRINHQRIFFPQINQFQLKMANYAIWDDHDYGPNNNDGTFYLKYASKKIFESMWANPPKGNEGDEDGIYFSFDWKDITVIMMDNRFERFNKKGVKQMWGPYQMEWLKAQLKKSKASFKFIVNGGQQLTQSRAQSTEALFYYRNEYDSLMSYIRNEKIEGVVFISGDIHSAELQKQNINGIYPLYEFTCSALTSSPYAGIKNQNVIPGCRTAFENNYGKISIIGKGKDRACVFENYNYRGMLKWKYSIYKRDLKF